MFDRILLFPYTLTLRIRHAMYDHGFIFKSHEADVPTICVGNLTAGGTGKTPHTEMILRTLMRSDDWAYRDVAVLSRGYKRRGKRFQQVTRDGSAGLYGDEPLQMKKKFPAVTVAVDKDRLEGCRLLCHPEELQSSKRFRKCRDKSFPAAELIVLDDAFQYRSLKATLNILLVNYFRPVSKDKMLPFGRLRDLPYRMGYADIIVVTKCPHYLEDFEREEFIGSLGISDFNAATCEGQGKLKPQKVFFTSIDHQPLQEVFADEGNPRYIYSKKLILFTGIANDLQLRRYLSDQYKIVKRFSFPDHHKYSSGDIRSILSAVKAWPTAAVATTEKDAQRVLDCRNVPSILRERLFEVPIEVSFLTEAEKTVFEESLLSAVRRS